MYLSFKKSWSFSFCSTFYHEKQRSLWILIKAGKWQLPREVFIGALTYRTCHALKLSMSESVKVIVRCRPLNEKEREMNTRLVIETNSLLHQCSIQRSGDDTKSAKNFTFDGVYGISSSTEVIYSEIVRPIVNGVVEGYNGTVFAYGQTSCGKTFTMDGIQTPSAQKGIIPRCCEHILSSTRQRSLENIIIIYFACHTWKFTMKKSEIC